MGLSAGRDATMTLVSTNSTQESGSSSTLFSTGKGTGSRTLPVQKRWLVLAAATAALGVTWTRFAGGASSAGVALAYVMSAMTKLIQSISALRPTKRLIRIAVATAASYLLVSALMQTRAVRKRQSIDATSEWGRYAAAPAARGRALMALCLRILPVYLIGMLVRDQDRKTRFRTKSGRMLAEGLLRLGPLYVKIGQIMSSQDKFLPSEWISSLEVLQDRVPASSGQDALDLAYASIGSRERLDELFSEFDTEPLAAASLGQVHKAVLRLTNETVAIKLQRPYLRQIYDQDLKFLLKIAGIMDNFVGKRSQVGGVAQSWTDIFTDAKEILYREIDYRDEADHMIRFAADFGLDKGGQAAEPAAKAKDNTTLPSAASWVRTPFVYKGLSSEKFLVMEFVPSVKITDSKKLESATNITAEEKEYLADSLARAYLRQFTVNKFFSTDPHAGNLGVERVPETGEVRLVMYDFGQVCELTSAQADGTLDVIEAIIDMDADKSVRAFDRMGVLTDDADLNLVRAKVQSNFDTGKVKVKRKKMKKKGYQFKKNAPDVSHMPTFSHENSTSSKDSDVMAFFTLPAEYAFVARALSQLHSVGKQKSGT
jgi:predicted unusual protein kinase regulating ubiquinone biosynthesis (AarF/ABC1/UbiB family)